LVLLSGCVIELLVIGGLRGVVGGLRAVVGGLGAVVGGLGAVIGGLGAVIGGLGAVVGGLGDVVGGLGAVVGSRLIVFRFEWIFCKYSFWKFNLILFIIKINSSIVICFLK